jgi:hypothetical protein
MTSPSEMPDWEEFRRVMRDLEARVAQLEARLGEPATVTTPMPAAPATEHAHIALATGAAPYPSPAASCWA